MKLTINALGQDINVADPFPAQGLLSITVPQGTSVSTNVSQDQLYRLAPQLADLESRVLPSGAPIMTWSVAPETGADARAEDAVPPVLSYMHPGQLSVGSGNVGVVLHGAGLLANQTKASVLIGTGAGSVLYTAVNPGSGGNSVTVKHVNDGPSQALSVTVSGSNVTVHLATNGSSVPTSTAAQVIAAVAAAASAAALVVGTVPNGAGTAQVAAATNLAGGKGGGVTVQVNGVTMPLTSITDTAITFTVTAGNMTGTAANDCVNVVYTAGLWTSDLSCIVVA
jgi:hypothetical protein